MYTGARVAECKIFCWMHRYHQPDLVASQVRESSPPELTRDVDELFSGRFSFAYPPEKCGNEGNDQAEFDDFIQKCRSWTL
jgi:hypothetical protein